MFNCAVCGSSVGPKIRAVRVTVNTRSAQYHNEYEVEDEWGNTQRKAVDSQGYETVREILACPPCAQESEPKPSLIVLGKDSFQEKPAEALRVKFAAIMGSNALDRLEHNSPRAKRDIAVAIPMLKQFVDVNKDFTF